MKENKVSVNGNEQSAGAKNVKTWVKVYSLWFLYDTVIGAMNGL